MKTLLLFTICFLSVQFSFAQTTEDSTKVEIVELPDVEAQYPGGMVAMQRFIVENLVYPDSVSFMDIPGKLYVQFVVQQDGSLTDIEVIRKVHPQLNQMAIDLIRKMPNWIPAEMSGKAVASRVRLPILIHLQ